MNLFRSFRRPAPVRTTPPDEAIIGWALHPSGRVDAIKQGSGMYGSGFGEGAFTETAFGANVALSQSVFGWAAAYSVSTWVYRCIEIRKSAVHRMPWNIINRQTKQRFTDHPLQTAFKRNKQKLLKKIEQGQLLFGESFIELAENRYGYRSDLFALNNLGMAVLVGEGRIIGYSYTAMQGGHAQNFEPEQVAFMKTDNPFNDLRGMSPTEVIMDEVGIDKDVARVVRAYYANDTRVGLLLIPKTQLYPADAERFMEMWKQQHQGTGNAGKPVLMPYDLSVERSQEPATLDDVDLRSSTRREIAAAYGVPLSMAGAWDDANYQSLPEQRKSFYEETIIPECDNIAEFINTDILPHFDDTGVAEFKFDYMQVLALTEDAQRKNDIYSNRLVSGLITRAEARAALGHPVRDADDVYYIPTGATVVPADEQALVTPTSNQVDSTPTQQEAPPQLPNPRPSGAQTPKPLPSPAQPKPLPAPAQPPSPAPGKAVDPLTELAQWERKALNTNAVKAAGFVCNVLPPDVQATVKAALVGVGKDASKAAIRAVFAAARKAVQPPAATFDYWKAHDDLMAELGDSWMMDYMRRALASLPLTPDLSMDAVQAALDAHHGAFTTAWLGTDDAPGPLVKLIQAGMAAGQMAIEHGSAANPRRPMRGKQGGVQIDWDLLAKEARAFAKEYLYNLIRSVDDTTRQAVSEAVTKWIESGEGLDKLKDALQAIFNDPARAQLIAQTESGRAYNAGALERYRRADVQKVRLMTVNDSHVCPQCSPLKGTVVSADEGWKTKDGNKFPPFHVQCRCWIRPVLSED